MVTIFSADISTNITLGLSSGPAALWNIIIKRFKVGHVEKKEKHLWTSRRWRDKWLDKFCQTMWSANASGILSSMWQICIINCFTEQYNTICHKGVNGIVFHDKPYQVHLRGREASPTEIAGQAQYVWWKPKTWNTAKGKLTVRQVATTYCMACSEWRELIGKDIKGRDMAAVAPSDREWLFANWDGMMEQHTKLSERALVNENTEKWCWCESNVPYYQHAYILMIVPWTGLQGWRPLILSHRVAVQLVFFRSGTY